MTAISDMLHRITSFEGVFTFQVIQVKQVMVLQQYYWLKDRQLEGITCLSWEYYEAMQWLEYHQMLWVSVLHMPYLRH